MATIERYATSAGTRYMVRYRTPERRQTKKRGFKTKRAAEEFAATVEVQKLQGDYVEASRGRVTVGDLGPPWLAMQTHLKPSSRRPLEIAWRVHVQPRWGPVRVSDVGFSAVQTWVSEMSDERGATTVTRALGVLSSILSDAVRDKRIRNNPCQGVKTPRKVAKRPEFLTHVQVADLAREAGDRATVILVLAYCGLRWGEMAGLRVKDVNFVRRRISVEQNAVEVGHKFVVGTPKSHERRTVPFPELLDEGLRTACRDKLPTALVFPDSKGGFMHNNTRGWFARAVARSGVPRLTPHDLRHTSASLAISSGANVKAIQRMLGHKSASVTLDIYSSLFDSDLDAVAVAMNAAAKAAHVGAR